MSTKRWKDFEVQTVACLPRSCTRRTACSAAFQLQYSIRQDGEEEEGIKRQREKEKGRGREGAATNANALTQRNNVGEC